MREREEGKLPWEVALFSSFLAREIEPLKLESVRETARKREKVTESFRVYLFSDEGC